MAFCQVQWFSKTIVKQVGMNVVLPDEGAGPFATFYLLHGLSDDYTIWHRRTRIEWYARAYPLIVVMPDGFRGFYTNNEQGPAYAAHFAEEMTGFIERTFPARKDRTGRCIGGLSMGGYGALRLALGYPTVYASATSHSGALLHGQKTWSASELAEYRRVFGPRPRGSSHDLLELARKAKAMKKLPKLRIDCGTEDFLLEDNRAFHASLEKLGIPHEYEEFPGGHEWDYWDQHVRDALAFHTRALGIVAATNRRDQ
jgi:putative tributyrin esterase